MLVGDINLLSFLYEDNAMLLARKKNDLWLISAQLYDAMVNMDLRPMYQRLR